MFNLYENIFEKMNLKVKLLYELKLLNSFTKKKAMLKKKDKLMEILKNTEKYSVL